MRSIKINQLLCILALVFSPVHAMSVQSHIVESKFKLVLYLDGVRHLGAHGTFGYPAADAKMPPPEAIETIRLKIPKNRTMRFKVGVIDPNGVEHRISLEKAAFTNLIKKKSDVPAGADIFFTSDFNILKFSPDNISVDLDLLSKNEWLRPPFMIDVVYMPDGEKSKVEDFFPFILVE